MREPSIPTVKFDASRVSDAVKENLKATIAMLPNIPVAYAGPLYEVTLRAIKEGGNLKPLFDALMDLGLEKSRAEILSIFLNRRAFSIMERERQLSLGITEAMWLYSGAPCEEDAKRPSEKDSQHRALDGQRFNIQEGILVAGAKTWPGYELGCKCISKSIIKGFE